MAKQWFVAITEWHKETLAERYLRSHGYESFNPRCTTQELRFGRKVAVVRPYVPGYVFVRFDANKPGWTEINRARGVRRLLCNTPETPTRVRQSVMEELFARCDGQVVDACVLDAIAMKHMPVGSRVRVLQGPFIGHEATVTLSTEQRLAAVLSIFGRQTTLDLKPSEVEPV